MSALVNRFFSENLCADITHGAHADSLVSSLFGMNACAMAFTR
jgi:hypothetical protein